jgi:prepilin-type N-terminal cleavage/methylation domain-containing protein
VAVCQVVAAACSRSERVSRRGFSLLELLVVIIVIGVVAVLAIPSMTTTRSDRRAYDDAGSVMQLFRSARTRAIARGGAVLITMTASGATDRGTFLMYEAVTTNAQFASADAGPGSNAPLATCKAPMNWATATGATNFLLVDGVNLNGTFEKESDIQTKLFTFATGATPLTVQGNLCWTPLGRSYFTTGAKTATMFDGLQSTATPPIEIEVLRNTGGGTYRSVLVPPNGMARLFSHTSPTQ